MSRYSNIKSEAGSTSRRLFLFEGGYAICRGFICYLRGCLKYYGQQL